MKTNGKFLQVLLLVAGLLGTSLAVAQNALETLEVSQQGGNVIVKLGLKQSLATPPAAFSVANPARIALDLPNTTNALGRNTQSFNEGDLRSANIVQSGDRTRLVLNLRKMTAFETRVDDKALVITLVPQKTAETAGTPTVSHFAESRIVDDAHSVRNINFRRGKDGEARIIVDLSDPNTGIDIHQQGASLIVDFIKTTLPENLRKRLDVTDFATPVTSINTLPQGENVRMVITPRGIWEHNAYQSDNQFVLEVKQVLEDPNKLVQGGRGGRYQGEKLSLNFQNVDVRAVLQVIADFTDFNIITSDTVSGNLTLRLKDVPWDQALDIVLDAKGLDKRKNGNVIWIAPRDELAAREKQDAVARADYRDIEDTRTESFQLNYQKAAAVQKLVGDKTQPILSKRGSAVVDERTNKLFVNDTPARLEDVRKLIAEIDVPARQVLIEARIVEAEDNFSKNLGVRFGYHDMNPASPANRPLQARIGGGIADTGFHTGQSTTVPVFPTDSNFVNLGAGAIATKPAGQFSLVLFNSAATRFLNLEITALEADGKGKVISSPRVMTANQVEALIEQGVEIPYQQATSSGATSISFRKANLALKVKPQITPDGRIMMQLDINKDTPNALISTGSGLAINTKHVKTEVLVENGGTVVIGGIYTQDESDVVTRVPFLGDLPYVGFLFKNRERRDNKTELLVFVTPKIISEEITLR